MVIIMGYLNPTKKIGDISHLNWMGGQSFDINDPFMRLKVAASCCFFGEPAYYQKDEKDTRVSKPIPHALTFTDIEYLRNTLDAKDIREWRGLSPKEMMESAIDAALKKDVETTLKIAIDLRNQDYIRVTPQVILVRAAKMSKGTGFIRDYAEDIIKRLDEPAIGLAYQLQTYGKPIPNSLKRAWRDAYERADAEYLAKYQLQNRTIKTRDVIRLVHPKSDDVNTFMRGLVTNTDNTWEAITSREGSNNASWTKALDVMNHMALLRNLGNLIKHSVDPSLYIDKLISGVKNGKQIPFRYLSAYKSVESFAPPKVLDGIESCMEVALENLPQFPGRTMSLCDNSGSATGTNVSIMGSMKVSSIANLSAVITGRVAEEGYIGVFGDRLSTMPIRKKSSIFDMVKEADKEGKTIGSGTENGIWLFWQNAIENREHWDNVFIYSDMQAGHGKLYGLNSTEYKEYWWPDSDVRYDVYGRRKPLMIDVPKLISAYRSKVNKDVNVFLVQVAGYQDTIIPEFYNRTYIMGGWSTGLLNFAHKMIVSNYQ
jgi:hypothetical protein